MIYYYKAFKPNKSVPIMMSIIMMIATIANPTIQPASSTRTTTTTIRTKMNRHFTSHTNGE